MPNDFEKIIAKKKAGPVEVEGEKPGTKEKVWLLDDKMWLGLLGMLPDELLRKGNPLRGLEIGGPKGWLAQKLQPVVKDKFKSKPIDNRNSIPGKDNNGIVSYGDSYVLWRHATHPNHELHGGGDVTGKYDAMEGFKLLPAEAARFVAKNKL